MKNYLSALMLCAPILSVQAQENNLNTVDDKFAKKLNMIVVTAQRIEKSKLEVASNLTYIDSDTIEDLNLKSLSDLISIIPNVSMQSVMGDYDYIQMRGMPRNGEQASVGVYIDGVPYSSLYGLNLDLNSVESVEVLRGPQANLFGKNSRDGVILINTKKGGDELAGQLSVGMGNVGRKSLEAQLSGPLIKDKLSFNFSGKMFKRDGFVHNNILDDSVDEADEKSTRINLDWVVNDRVTVSITNHHVRKDNGTYPYVDGAKKFDKGDRLTTDLDTDNMLKQKINNLSVVLNWQINDTWSFGSITSLDKTNTFGRFDADLSSLAYGHYDSWIDEKEIYQEFRLASTHGQGDIDYLFGLSFNKSKDTFNNEYLLFGEAIDGKATRDTLIGYGDITWHLPQDWKLQSGARWVHEKNEVIANFPNHCLSFCSTFPWVIALGTG